MRVLLIGDVHAKLDDLDDCDRLQKLILRTLIDERPDTVVYLGDQYHTHAIVNVAVQRFWLGAFDELRRVCTWLEPDDIVTLIGNHDRPGDRTSEATAMQVHEHQVTVVHGPIKRGGVLFVSYCHNPEDLVEMSQEHPECKTLVCHQTFDGAKYDNGFYAKEALSPLRIKQPTIISGHIHTPSAFGNVWYPGSPRWLTLSDANQNRALSLVTFGDDGAIMERKDIPTDNVLRKMWQIVDRQGAPVPGPSVEELLSTFVKFDDRVVISLEGPAAWCEERKVTLAQARGGMRFRTFYTDVASPAVKESDGIGVAFRKHFEAFRPKYGTAKDILGRLVQERAHVTA